MDSLLGEIRAQIDLILAEIHSIRQQLIAVSHNSLSRARNGRTLIENRFANIRSEIAGPNINSVHFLFPNNPIELAELTGSQLDILEVFYGLEFSGTTLASRQRQFSIFIGYDSA